MVVYADVLITLNLFVNFFILKFTCRICKESHRIIRLIFAAFVGALFSLYIFLPSTGIFIEIIFKFVISALIILLGFGFNSIKSFLRRIGIFFAVSFLYAGAMMGIWAIFRPKQLAINNGIVYLNISPTVLIIATLISYFILSIIRFFSSKQAYNGKRCRLILSHDNCEICFTALVDTGHSLKDLITDKNVVIIEKNLLLKITDKIPSLTAMCDKERPPGFRLIPYTSVGGHGLLPAFSPDKLAFEQNGKWKEITNALIALCDEPLGEDYKAIVNPETLETL